MEHKPVRAVVLKPWTNKHQDTRAALVCPSHGSTFSVRKQRERFSYVVFSLCLDTWKRFLVMKNKCDGEVDFCPCVRVRQCKISRPSERRSRASDGPGFVSCVVRRWAALTLLTVPWNVRLEQCKPPPNRTSTVRQQNAHCVINAPKISLFIWTISCEWTKLAWR